MIFLQHLTGMYSNSYVHNMTVERKEGRKKEKKETKKGRKKSLSPLKITTSLKGHGYLIVTN